jgi:hypothetical protein
VRRRKAMRLTVITLTLLVVLLPVSVPAYAGPISFTAVVIHVPGAELTIGIEINNIRKVVGVH